MEQKPKIVALVPLRGGSKSIPYKNIRNIAGRPLCYWVLQAASESSLFDDIYVSTDSEKISSAVSSLALPVKIVKRKPSLAGDSSSTESVMVDFMNEVDFDILVTIQATSPLTRVEDFDLAIKLFLDKGFDSMLTGVRVKRFYWSNDNKPVNYNPLKRPRRQEFEGYIMENGAFYLTKKNVLVKTKCRLGGNIGIYEMLPETSFEIDELMDWKIVEQILIEKKKRNIENLVKNVKMLLMDADGVLTDSFVYYDHNGNEIKRFSVRDGMGIEMIRNKGIKTGIITKERSGIVETRAKKLKIDYVYQGVENKIQALMKISIETNITLENIAYIGDDINDLKVLKAVGFSAVPQNSINSLKSFADYVCLNDGGASCVRELCDLILD